MDWDLPRGGPEPDGDTVKFAPDNPALVESIPRVSGRPPGINARGISVRLEAIDALETHFSEAHQQLAGANLARDELLARLGFTNVVFFPDLPNKVQSAGQDSVRGHVLSNGIDANGRMIGFVFAGEPAEPDGARVFLDEARAARSLNIGLLTDGLAYPAYYGTLPGDLRTSFSMLSRAARAAGTGVWAHTVAGPDGAATVADLAQLETLAMWPKLFRRLVPFLATGAADFDGFDAWLRADPVHRDDALFLLDRLEPGNLHDVIVGAGHTIQLTAWPEDFIIGPDPAPGTPNSSGGTTVPASATTASVLVIAALPDPAGADAGAESVTLLNVSDASVDLGRLALADAAGGTQALSGQLAAGETVRVPVAAPIQLGNLGDTIRLADVRGQVVDQVAYVRTQVRAGRTVAFGR